MSKPSQLSNNDAKFITPKQVPKIIETLEKYQFEFWNNNQDNQLDNSGILNEFVTTKI